MATTFTGTVKLSVTGKIENTLDISGPAEYPISWSRTTSYTNGTGSEQANMVWTDTRTIAASSDDNIDLTALTNAFGNAIAFTSVKSIIISASEANTNNLLIGGDATAAFSTPFAAADNEVTVPPGGCLYLESKDAAGYAVTATTADILEITNSSSGTGVDYDIILIGTV